MSAENSNQTLFSEGMIVLLTSVLGYSVIFVYLYSFVDSYDIPIEMISFGLTELLTFGFKFLKNFVGFFIVYFVLTVTADLWFPKRFESKIYRYFFLAHKGIYVMCFFYLITFGRYNEDLAKYAGGGMILMAILSIIALVMPHQKGKAFTERLEDQTKVEMNAEVLPSINRLEKRYSFSKVKAGVVTLSMLYFAFLAGSGEARIKSEYFLTTDEKHVVLLFQSDRAIIAPYDKFTNSYKKTFSMLKTTEPDGKNVFISKKIGLLKKPTDENGSQIQRIVGPNDI